MTVSNKEKWAADRLEKIRYLEDTYPDLFTVKYDGLGHHGVRSSSGHFRMERVNIGGGLHDLGYNIVITLPKFVEAHFASEETQEYATRILSRSYMVALLYLCGTTPTYDKVSNFGLRANTLEAANRGEATGMYGFGYEIEVSSLSSSIRDLERMSLASFQRRLRTIFGDKNKLIFSPNFEFTRHITRARKVIEVEEARDSAIGLGTYTVERANREDLSGLDDAGLTKEARNFFHITRLSFATLPFIIKELGKVFPNVEIKYLPTLKDLVRVQYAPNGQGRQYMIMLGGSPDSLPPEQELLRICVGIGLITQILFEKKYNYTHRSEVKDTLYSGINVGGAIRHNKAVWDFADSLNQAIIFAIDTHSDYIGSSLNPPRFFLYRELTHLAVHLRALPNYAYDKTDHPDGVKTPYYVFTPDEVYQRVERSRAIFFLFPNLKWTKIQERSETNFIAKLRSDGKTVDLQSKFSHDGNSSNFLLGVAGTFLYLFPPHLFYTGIAYPDKIGIITYPDRYMAGSKEARALMEECIALGDFLESTTTLKFDRYILDMIQLVEFGNPLESPKYLEEPSTSSQQPFESPTISHDTSASKELARTAAFYSAQEDDLPDSYASTPEEMDARERELRKIFKPRKSG